ncbi:MAG: hypothetical protein ACRC0V_05080 [Fusobacteriaceae bacterium]
MKKILVILMLMLSVLSFSEIKVKVIKFNLFGRFDVEEKINSFINEGKYKLINVAFFGKDNDVMVIIYDDKK